MIGMFSIGSDGLWNDGQPVADDDKKTVGIGPVQSIQDLQDSAKMLFKLADTNNDGQISQKEATDAGNLLVGGFFFRADANGDGTLTPEEAKQARDTLFAQQPLLKLVLRKGQANRHRSRTTRRRRGQPSNDPATTAKQLAANPEQTIGNLLDTNHDQKIQATEVRQAVQSGVQALFSIADTNQDGQLSPTSSMRPLVKPPSPPFRPSFRQPTPTATASSRWTNTTRLSLSRLTPSSA